MGTFLLITIFLNVILAIIVIVGIWKTFKKAGQPGWGCLIPIYNIYLMTQIARKPGWWVIMCLIPLVNIVFLIMIYHGISTQFGKGVGFTLGLLFLSFIFFPILGFGDAKYKEEGNKKEIE